MNIYHKLTGKPDKPTEAEKATILEMRGNKFPIRSIATRLHRSQLTVRRVLAESGFQQRKSHLDVRNAQIVSDYKKAGTAYLTIAQIAERHNLTGRAVMDVIRASGIPMRVERDGPTTMVWIVPDWVSAATKQYQAWGYEPGVAPCRGCPMHKAMVKDHNGGLWSRQPMKSNGICDDCQLRLQHSLHESGDSPPTRLNIEPLYTTSRIRISNDFKPALASVFR